MPDSALAKPAVYVFRVRILGGFYAPRNSRQIWREIELTSRQTLKDLGDAIPLAFEFYDPHQWSFFLSGKAWDDASEYALEPEQGFGGRRKKAANRLQLGDAPLAGEFLFLFDYGDEWHFGVKFVRTNDAPDSGASYPRVVAQHGDAPAQYLEIDEDEDEEAD